MKPTTTKQTGHTPGPIRFEGWFPPREPGLLPSVKLTWDGRMIQMFSNDLEQAEKDAHLIESAPDLLAQLQALSVQIEEYGLIVPPGVRAAISKATGGDK